MGFYAYSTTAPDAPGLTDEPLGTHGRVIRHDLRTARGMVAHCERLRLRRPFKMFSFERVYDDATYRLITVVR